MVEIFLRNPDLILAASQFSARPGSERSHLAGVRIEVRALPEDNDTPYEHEVFIVATDGAMMFVGRVLAEVFVDLEEFTLPLEAIRSLKAGRFTGIQYDPDAGHVRIRSGGESNSFKVLSDGYPKWRQVVPGSYEPEPAMYDPSLMVRVDRARRALGVKSPVAITPCGTNPGYIEFHRPDCFGQIMPLHNPFSDGPPLWVR